MYSLITDNYYKALDRISKVAIASGRNPDEIRLVVVTKTQPVENIHVVIDAGATDIGENYVEDALEKMPSFTGIEKIKWHMIGHVQSRKAIVVCEKFQFLHSLDSYKLAEKLNNNLTIMKKVLPVWLEFNICGEVSKSGWDLPANDKWSEILPDIEKLFSLPQLDFLGVMAIPPFSENPDDSRHYYRKLRKLQNYIIHNLKPKNFSELSIGMSGDFEVAIEEGSTCVRLGQYIFGPRQGNQIG